MRNEWTEEKARELIEYYSSHTAKQTARKYQLTVKSVVVTVARLSKKYNISNTKRNEWTEEKAREFIEYYTNHTAEETAEKYQISISYVHSAVTQLSKKYNISKDRKAHAIKWTEEKAKELIEYYNSHTAEETAEKYQLTVKSVIVIVDTLSKKYNIFKIDKRNRWTEEKARELIEYYSSHTAKQTAEKYQLTISHMRIVVTRLSKKYNISKDRKDTTKWTEEKARELIEYYSSHTAKQTARKYQRTPHSIRTIVSRLSKKYNIPKKET